MAQEYFHGKTSYFSVNGTTYHGSGWAVDVSVDDLRTDNTASGGYADRIAGVRDLKATIELNFDASINVFDSPPALKAGQTLSTVKLYLNGTSSPYWSIPSALVLSTPMESKVGSVTKITFTIANKGTFTEPTGTFTAA